MKKWNFEKLKCQTKNGISIFFLLNFELLEFGKFKVLNFHMFLEFLNSENSVFLFFEIELFEDC